MKRTLISLTINYASIRQYGMLCECSMYVVGSIEVVLSKNRPICAFHCHDNHFDGGTWHNNNLVGVTRSFYHFRLL